MEFMHDGGMPMWLTLTFFLASVGASIAYRTRGGWRIGLAGAIVVLASGLAGFSTGLYMTVGAIARVPVAERAEILGLGLRESVNNTLFAAVLATLLGVLVLAIGRMDGATVKHA